ncbi:hypothetical protein HDC37_003087 [Microbacterium sp. AK009]|nr:hypothetical protein [Microbacterium sp. AK009]NYF18231.1 hypothetical protein [Microbacterium sp. AK009]
MVSSGISPAAVVVVVVAVESVASVVGLDSVVAADVALVGE